MNKVLLMGRLIKDADVRYSNEKAVSRFTLAVDRRFAKDNEQSADFVSCVSFGKTAEFFEKFGRKGVKFVIEGRIQTGNYKNKDGQTVYTTDVVVESAEFAESKKSEDKPTPSGDEGFMSIPDSIDAELPFA